MLNSFSVTVLLTLLLSLLAMLSMIYLSFKLNWNIIFFAGIGLPLFWGILFTINDNLEKWKYHWYFPVMLFVFGITVGGLINYSKRIWRKSRRQFKPTKLRSIGIVILIFAWLLLSVINTITFINLMAKFNYFYDIAY